VQGQELLDVYDEQGNPAGVAARSEVHAKGLWHRTFQCWIYKRVHGETYLLFQLRHREKDTFPGLLDISSAGHLASGERPEDGVRELYEELGVEAAYTSLVPCGVFTGEALISESLIDREFCHVYVYECEQPLERYRPQPDEVSGLFYLRAADVSKLLTEDAPVQAEGVAASGDGGLRAEMRTVRAADLVPHPIRYYAMVFDALRRLGCGDAPELPVT
jgi:isopentenyldiphosphate isomerase